MQIDKQKLIKQANFCSTRASEFIERWLWAGWGDVKCSDRRSLELVTTPGFTPVSTQASASRPIRSTTTEGYSIWSFHTTGESSFYIFLALAPSRNPNTNNFCFLRVSVCNITLLTRESTRRRKCMWRDSNFKNAISDSMLDIDIGGVHSTQWHRRPLHSSWTHRYRVRMLSSCEHFHFGLKFIEQRKCLSRIA